METTSLTITARPLRTFSRTAESQRPAVAAVINRLLSERVVRGLPTFNMNQGLIRAPNAKKLLANMSAPFHGRELWRMGPVEGLMQLREQVAEWRGRTVVGGLTAQNVMITCGANNAHHVVMSLLSDPGDLVICPRPYFFNHANLIRQSSRAIVTPSLRFETSSERNDTPDSVHPLVSGDQLSESGVEDARYLIISNPHNPTGLRFDPAELASLQHWSAEHGAAFVVDESYFGSERSDDLVQAWADLSTTIVIGSLSKSVCLGDLRLGYIIADERSIERMVRLQDNLVICPSLLAQDIASVMIAKRDRYLPGVWEEIQQRSELLDWRFRKGGLTGTFGDAAVFKWIRTPDSIPDEQLVLALAEATGVIGTPGTYYGCKGYIRLSYGMLSGMVETNEAGSRVVEFLGELNARHS